MIPEVGADLFDELSDVVVNRAAPPAHHMKMVVGMGDLPSRRSVDSEMRFPNQVEILEERQRSIDRRDVDGGVGLVDSNRDLLGGEVAVGAAQN